MAILKDTLIQGACRVIGDAYFNAIKSGAWNGTAVAVAYGGTGATTAAGARTNLGIGSVGTLNYGSDTTKYLRNDGSWQVPPNNNTTYKFTIGSTTKGDSTNGVDLGTLKSESAASSNTGSTLSLVTTGEKYTWNNKGSYSKPSGGIPNTDLANSSISIAGTSVSLGGSITADTLKSNLGLGSNAYSSTAYLPLTNTESKTVQFTVNDVTDMLKVKRGSANYSMIVFANTSGNLGLLGFTSSSVPTYRTASGTDYTLLHAGNYTSYVYSKSTSDGRYVYKAGDTMTGALTVPSISVTGAATFSQAINGSILGNAATASRLANIRNIALSGAVTGNANFDGSGNITISTTVNHNHNSSYMTAASLFTGASAATSSSVSKTNGNVYLNLTKTINGTASNVGSIKISGSGGSSVTTDSSGNISINSPSVYSILNVDGSNEPQANNIKYYSVTDLYPSTETLGVQYLITCSNTESYIISFGTNRNDNSQIYCDIVALNKQSTLDEFKFSNRTLYFKHDASTGLKYYDIQIKQISGPKKSPSKSLITETAYNNVGSSYIKTAGYIYNSNNSSCYIRHNETSMAYYYRITGLMGDDGSTFANSQHLYTISCREGFYLLQCESDQINMYTIKAGGIVGFKYVRGYYYGDSPGGLYLYITSGNATFTGNTTIRQIGGLPSKLTVEEISSSTYDGLSGAVTTNESRTFYHTGNLNPSKYEMHYESESVPSGSVLYIPDDTEGPVYHVDTITSSNSNTTFYYMWLDGQPDWTSYYNYMRYQLIVNNKSVDITIQMNVGNHYYAPSNSFVVPAGYCVEMSVYQPSSSSPMMITWSSPIKYY